MPVLESAGRPALVSVGVVDVGSGGFVLEPEFRGGVVLESAMVIESRQSKAKAREKRKVYGSRNAREK